MENSENIEFRKLGLCGFEQFHEMIERGTIICPNPLVWKNFYKQFVKRAEPDRLCTNTAKSPFVLEEAYQRSLEN